MVGPDQGQYETIPIFPRQTDEEKAQLQSVMSDVGPYEYHGSTVWMSHNASLGMRLGSKIRGSDLGEKGHNQEEIGHNVDIQYDDNNHINGIQRIGIIDNVVNVYGCLGSLKID